MRRVEKTPRGAALGGRGAGWGPFLDVPVAYGIDCLRVPGSSDPSPSPTGLSSATQQSSQGLGEGTVCLGRENSTSKINSKDCVQSAVSVIGYRTTRRLMWATLNPSCGARLATQQTATEHVRRLTGGGGQKDCVSRRWRGS